MRQILKHIEHTKKRWSGHEEWPFTSIWSQLASWCPHESKTQIANPEKEEPGSRITRTLHRSPNRHTNVLVETNIRCITPHIRSSPSCVTNVACIPNWSIQKHGFLRESLPSLFSTFLTTFPSINHSMKFGHHFITYSWNASEQSNPRSWISSLFPLPAHNHQVSFKKQPQKEPVLSLTIITWSVVISLYDGLVFTKKLKVDLILGLVTFERRKIDVEVKATRVTFGALDERTESAVMKAGGTAPPCAPTVVVCESDGIGLRAVSACLWGVVYGDLVNGLGLVVDCWIRHFYFLGNKK